LVTSSILELETKPETQPEAQPEKGRVQTAPQQATIRKPPLPALTGIRTLLAIFIILFHFTPPHLGLYVAEDVFVLGQRCPKLLFRCPDRLREILELVATRVLRVAVVALIDGFALQRFALPRDDSDRQQLAAGLRILFHAYVD